MCIRDRPIIVKIAAVHNVAAIASGIARSGADIIAIDGFRGGTGAAPTRIRDNVGIPIELALAAVDSRLRAEGIRGDVSLVVGGSIRSSADVVKAVALGADAVYIATSALLALGCHLCRTCQLGRCNCCLLYTSCSRRSRVTVAPTIFLSPSGATRSRICRSPLFDSLTEL